MPGLITPEVSDATGITSVPSNHDGAPDLEKRSQILERLAGAVEIFLRALLVAVLIGVVGVSFRTGIEREGAGRLFNSDFGTILYAICANLSYNKYHSGRYVCTNSAEKQMHEVGLWYDDATLARIGKTLQQWEADGASLNHALMGLFASPPLASDGGAYAYGWGGDAGYMDFLQFAFRLFGNRLEALYYAYFFLLMISLGLFCIQFWRNYLALFAAVAFQFSTIPYLDVLSEADIGSFSNPRLLSLLAIIPMFHALFLIVYRVRFSLWSVLLFVPQAILLAAAADFRALSYATVIALTVCCLALLIVDRRKMTLRQAGWRYWPMYALFGCLVTSSVLQVATADPRIAQTGGMRFHTFWEPLFWNLDTDPVDWKSMSAQFQGASGDVIAQVAVQSYRARHDLLHVKEDFIHGDESQGLTQMAYEKYTRKAFIEFARKNPGFIARLKYYNAMNMIYRVKGLTVREWEALDWRLFALGGIVAFALVAEIRRKTESLRRVSICAGLLALSGLVVALPVWATAVEPSIMTDLTLFNISNSFVLALWMIVFIGVLVSMGRAEFWRY